MKPKLSDSLLAEQLKFLMPRVLIGDAVLFFACLPLYGPDPGIILGLLLGTAAMTVNLALLSYSVRHAVDRGSEKSARRYMMFFYIIRFTIMGAAIALGFTNDNINSVCTFLPLLWPKVFYTLSGFKDHIKFVLGEKRKKK